MQKEKESLFTRYLQSYSGKIVSFTLSGGEVVRGIVVDMDQESILLDDGGREILIMRDAFKFWKMP